MRLAIIGSAGRGKAAKHINKDLWKKMYMYSQGYISGTVDEGKHFNKHYTFELVSGGAALADHLAVALFNSKDKLPELDITSLDLFLPAYFEDGEFQPTHRGAADAWIAETANKYHRTFSKIVAGDPERSLKSIDQAIKNGAHVHINLGGFYHRNIDLANFINGKKNSTLLAFTFEEGEYPKEGGTAHTWRHTAAHVWKEHVNLLVL